MNFGLTTGKTGIKTLTGNFRIVSSLFLWKFTFFDLHSGSNSFPRLVNFVLFL
jgi:hypothetical protein